jgi:hypothetical protein
MRGLSISLQTKVDRMDDPRIGKEVRGVSINSTVLKSGLIFLWHYHNDSLHRWIFEEKPVNF